MRPIRLLTIVLSVCAPVAADELNDRVKAIIDSPAYAPARWGILVVDAETGKPIFERDPDKLMLPASVTKLYTCATALAELGPDHRFVTPVYRRGEVVDGVLRGDLILVASGDLTMGGRQGKSGKATFTNTDHTYANSGLGAATLTDSDPLAGLKELAQQVSKAGIKEVTGEVLVDDRLFARTRSSGSGPEVVSPVLINDNCVDVIVTPGRSAGDPAMITLRPETALIQMDGDVRTTSGGVTRVTIESMGSGQFSVRGVIPIGAKPAVRIFPVDDPSLFARALFIESLRSSGVRVNATIHRPRRAELPAMDAKLPQVAERKSEPLSEAIAVTLKVSHNLYASTLPVLVGTKHGRGTAEAGLQRQAKVLQGLGVSPDQVSFAGGAGGANADSVTARATVSLLRGMAKHSAANVYFEGLPVLGVDGTLAEAVGKDSPARGKVKAKTGTLVWVDSQNERMLLRSKALAGQLETARGTKLYFAMFVNDLPLKPKQTASDIGKVLGKLCEVIHQHGR